MHRTKIIAGASLVAALAGVSVLAQPRGSRSADTREAPRVTQTVNNTASTVVRNSHLGFVDTLKPTAAVATTCRCAICS